MANSSLERTPEERDITLERIRMMADGQLGHKPIRGSVTPRDLRDLFGGKRQITSFKGEGFYRVKETHDIEEFAAGDICRITSDETGKNFWYPSDVHAVDDALFMLRRFISASVIDRIYADPQTFPLVKDYPKGHGLIDEAIMSDRSNTLFVDFGSGDGRPCLVANLLYRFQTVGIERDPVLLAMAHTNMMRAPLNIGETPRNMRFVHGSFFDESLLEETVGKKRKNDGRVVCYMNLAPITNQVVSVVINHLRCDDYIICHRYNIEFERRKFPWAKRLELVYQTSSWMLNAGEEKGPTIIYRVK